MRSRTINEYIYFGTVLRFLQDGIICKIHEEGFIIENIESFFRYLEMFNLPVTARASYELKEFYEELKKTDADHFLTEEEARKLKRIMTDLRKTLVAESLGNVAFIVTDKRFDVTKLLSNVSGLLPKDVFQKLPDISQFDLEESGKCIAFERPTAAAFHILRGTEGVLRKYYTVVTLKDPGNLSWGQILTELKNMTTNRPSDKILDVLTSIKDNYRNPTQHPEATYTIEEVQTLFGICIAAISQMAEFL